MKTVFLALLLLFQFQSALAGPSVSGGGMGRRFFRLKCEAGVDFLFGDRLGLGFGPGSTIIQMSVKGDSQLEIKANEAYPHTADRRVITLLDNHPYCERSIAEDFAGRWTFRSKCEGTLHLNPCAAEIVND